MKKKAISLIVLVITIIVMAILAATVIITLSNTNIINEAQKAKESANQATEKEAISVALAEWKIEERKGTKTFEEFMKEKFGEENVTKISEDEVTVTMESGNKYEAKTDGTIKSTKGINLDKSTLTLELQDGTTVVETLTASLSKITGEITWSNSDNTTATISTTTGESITVTAKAIGTTTITATCGSYVATCTVTVTKPTTVSIGAFVEYAVSYTDAFNSDYKYTTTNGWRLLDYTKNSDGTYSNVKLISTGVPAKLYYNYSDTTYNSWYVTDDTKLSEFKNVLGSDYNYYTGTDTYYALRAAAGLYYNFGDINFAYGTSSAKNKGYFTEITSNGTTYNSENTADTTGRNLFIPAGVNASVRLLTLPEMNKMLGRTDIDSTTQMTDPTGADGLFVLQNVKNITAMSAFDYSAGCYWLASPYPNAKNYNSVSYVLYSGIVNGISSYGYGVRPVVTLSSDIQLVDENSDGVLEIKK